MLYGRLNPSADVPRSAWQDAVADLQRGNLEDALKQLQVYVRSNPNSFEGNNFLGVALAQVGRHREAIEHLQKAIQINPQSAQAHYNLGLAQMGLQNNDAARAAFGSALQIDSQYQPAKTALQRLPGSTGAVVTQPSQPALVSPWDMSAANLSGDVSAVVHEPRSDLTASEITLAFFYGTAAALIGAFIWDKFVYYTHIEFGLIAVLIGVMVGASVMKGGKNKGGLTLQIMGAFLSCFGILLGYIMIVMDERIAMGDTAGTLHLFMEGLSTLPTILSSDLLSLVFIAIGAWYGWSLPRKRIFIPTAIPPTR